MTETVVDIKTLINSNSLSADKITQSLSKIGDGNMLDGIRTVFNYAYTESAKIHFALGSLITAATLTTAYIGYKGIRYLLSEAEKKKPHKASEAKIYAALSNNKTDTFIKENTDEQT